MQRWYLHMKCEFVRSLTLFGPSAQAHTHTLRILNDSQMQLMNTVDGSVFITIDKNERKKTRKKKKRDDYSAVEVFIKESRIWFWVARI